MTLTVIRYILRDQISLWNTEHSTDEKLSFIYNFVALLLNTLNAYSFWLMRRLTKITTAFANKTLQCCLKHFFTSGYFMCGLLSTLAVGPFALKPSERKIFRTLLQHRDFLLRTGTISKNCFNVKHCIHPGRASSSETPVGTMRYFRAKVKFRDVWNDQNRAAFWRNHTVFKYIT